MSGAVFVDSEEEVPEGAVCIFSAHGVSPAVRDNATERSLEVIDATCPLVSKVHQEARRHARDGKTILLIGHANHEEVEGTFGHARTARSSSTRWSRSRTSRCRRTRRSAT
ncbi:hypothetical protein NKG94_31350 [Micromonospora sp. M12]